MNVLWSTECVQSKLCFLYPEAYLEPSRRSKMELFVNLVYNCVAPWCSGYHYCTTSFSKVWTQILRRFKPCLIYDGKNLWQWSRLKIRRKHLSSVNHTTIAIHHHHHHQLKAVNYFCKKFHVRCLTGFRMRFWYPCYKSRFQLCEYWNMLWI